MWPHKLYWILNLLTELSITIIVLVNMYSINDYDNDRKNSKYIDLSYVLNWLGVIFLSLYWIIITLFSILFRRQDIYEYEDYSCFSFNIPS